MEAASLQDLNYNRPSLAPLKFRKSRPVEGGRVSDGNSGGAGMLQHLDKRGGVTGSLASVDEENNSCPSTPSQAGFRLDSRDGFIDDDDCFSAAGLVLHQAIDKGMWPGIPEEVHRSSSTSHNTFYSSKGPPPPPANYRHMKPPGCSDMSTGGGTSDARHKGGVSVGDIAGFSDVCLGFMDEEERALEEHQMSPPLRAGLAPPSCTDDEGGEEDLVSAAPSTPPPGFSAPTTPYSGGEEAQEWGSAGGYEADRAESDVGSSVGSIELQVNPLFTSDEEEPEQGEELAKRHTDSMSGSSGEKTDPSYISELSDHSRKKSDYCLTFDDSMSLVSEDFRLNREQARAFSEDRQMFQSPPKLESRGSSAPNMTTFAGVANGRRRRQMAGSGERAMSISLQTDLDRRLRSNVPGRAEHFVSMLKRAHSTDSSSSCSSSGRASFRPSGANTGCCAPARNRKGLTTWARMSRLKTPKKVWRVDSSAESVSDTTSTHKCSDNNNQDMRAPPSPLGLYKAFVQQRSSESEASEGLPPTPTSHVSEPPSRIPDGREAYSPIPAESAARTRPLRVTKSASIPSRRKSCYRPIRHSKSLMYFFNRPLPSLEFLSREPSISNLGSLSNLDPKEFDSLVEFCESAGTTPVEDSQAKGSHNNVQQPEKNTCSKTRSKGNGKTSEAVRRTRIPVLSPQGQRDIRASITRQNNSKSEGDNGKLRGKLPRRAVSSLSSSESGTICSRESLLPRPSSSSKSRTAGPPKPPRTSTPLRAHPVFRSRKVAACKSSPEAQDSADGVVMRRPKNRAENTGNNGERPHTIVGDTPSIRSAINQLSQRPRKSCLTKRGSVPPPQPQMTSPPSRPALPVVREDSPLMSVCPSCRGEGSCECAALLGNAGSRKSVSFSPAVEFRLPSSKSAEAGFELRRSEQDNSKNLVTLRNNSKSLVTLRKKSSVEDCATDHMTLAEQSEDENDVMLSSASEEVSQSVSMEDVATMTKTEEYHVVSEASARAPDVTSSPEGASELSAELVEFEEDLSACCRAALACIEAFECSKSTTAVLWLHLVLALRLVPSLLKLLQWDSCDTWGLVKEAAAPGPGTKRLYELCRRAEAEEDSALRSAGGKLGEVDSQTTLMARFVFWLVRERLLGYWLQHLLSSRDVLERHLSSTAPIINLADTPSYHAFIHSSLDSMETLNPIRKWINVTVANEVIQGRIDMTDLELPSEVGVLLDVCASEVREDYLRLYVMRPRRAPPRSLLGAALSERSRDLINRVVTAARHALPKSASVDGLLENRGRSHSSSLDYRRTSYVFDLEDRGKCSGSADSLLQRRKERRLRGDEKSPSPIRVKGRKDSANTSSGFCDEAGMSCSMSSSQRSSLRSQISQLGSKFLAAVDSLLASREIPSTPSSPAAGQQQKPPCDCQSRMRAASHVLAGTSGVEGARDGDVCTVFARTMDGSDGVFLDLVSNSAIGAKTSEKSNVNGVRVAYLPVLLRSCPGNMGSGETHVELAGSIAKLPVVVCSHTDATGNLGLTVEDDRR